MATTFQESGSDATGDLSFYSSTVGTVTSSTEQSRTGLRSVKCDSGAGNLAHISRANVLADSGRRISVGVYFDQFHATAGCSFYGAYSSGGGGRLHLQVTSGGVLHVRNSSNAQIGSNGSTLSTGRWYRITLCYTIASTAVNEIRVYLDDSTTPDISITDASLPSINTNMLSVGWVNQNGTLSGGRFVYIDDVYVDDSTSLAAFSGDIRVTNKKPAALNMNNFDTGIGSGTNRWDRVSEVPYSETNGWQHAAATDVQENYGLQAASAGDANLSGATLISRTAWLIGKRSALTPCTHRASAASGSTNPTTTLTITIPAGTATGDSLFCQVTSRDHTAGTAYVIVTDNDTGGNAWARIAESDDRKATLWWKRATGGTASKTITVADCVGSCTGGVAVYQGAATSATPYTNIVIETNASADETHASFTPDNAGSAICFGIFNYIDDDTVSGESTASLGAMSQVWQHESTGGSDCGCSHAHIDGTDTAPAATGNITWAQANSTTYSISWAVKPETGTTAPAIMDNGSETALALAASSALYTKLTDSASYPSNGAGIGMRSSGSSIDTFLYECGTIFAYIPGEAPPPGSEVTFIPQRHFRMMRGLGR